MELKLELPSPEDINRQITESVAKSMIGKVLTESVERKVKELSSSWNNPIDAVVGQEIQKILMNIVSKEYDQILRAKVKAKLTEAFVDELFEKMWTNFKNRD